MSEGGEPSAPATPGLLLLSYTTPRDAAIRHSWEELKRTISEYDLSAHEGRPHRRILVPKQDSNFRVAVQLDPIDSIVYLALAYEVATRLSLCAFPCSRE
jgi:hypothetical protein